ncbi:MAG: hypothetical protein O7D32_10365 [bacterium]|nr:hypothetical protein [bacterium]
MDTSAVAKLTKPFILLGVKLIMDGIVLIAWASVARAAGAAISRH